MGSGKTRGMWPAELRYFDVGRRTTRHLGARGIEAPFHYQPLHASPMGQSFGAQPEDCPVATRLGQGVLRLPMHNALTESEIERVIEAVRAFDGGSAAG